MASRRDLYLICVQRAEAIPGDTPAWNRRFRESLATFGLEISATNPAPRLDSPEYPHGAPMMMPIPVPGGRNGWPYPSYIVWKN